MIVQQKDIEQLWYTWSDVGYDTIREGFRIRAASEGLQDLRSSRVRGLAQYQHYSLPRDANPSFSLEYAPVSLAFLITDQERILLYKTYTGRDAVGRYGVFFLHLLINLPGNFSAADAIRLWKSPFLQRSDETLPDRRITQLERVSPEDLRHASRETATRKQRSLDVLKKFLPYIIETYLGKTDQQRLYIAAADDDIAQLISGLISCLPTQLTKKLTFSTYEYDVTEATTEIVGTCWLSVKDAEKDPHVHELLPADYYQRELAVNCYDGQRTPLAHHPLANALAEDATEYFLTGSHEEFQDCLDLAREDPDLDKGTFLRIYEITVFNAENPSRAQIEHALRPRSSIDYKTSIKLLNRPRYQQTIINLSLDPSMNWWQESGREALINLHKLSLQIPGLAESLAKLARHVEPEFIEMVKQGVNALKQRQLFAELPFYILLDLMVCAEPPGTDNGVWTSLLEELLAIRDILVFFSTYPNLFMLFNAQIDALFLQLAKNPPQWPDAERLFKKLVKSGYPRKMLILSILLDSEMGNQEHTVISLLNIASPDVSERAQFLQHYGRRYLAASPHLFDVMQNMLKDLVRNGPAQEKMQVLSTWLNPVLADEKSFVTTLNNAHLNPEEAAFFFQQYGKSYIAHYPNLPVMIDLFRYAQMAESLRFSLITYWLKKDLSQQTLEQLLIPSSFSSPYLFLILEQSGEKYLSLYPTTNAFTEYLRIYLENIQAFHLADFKVNKARAFSQREQFLTFLLHYKHVKDYAREIIADWLIVGAFVRKSFLTEKDIRPLSDSLARLLNNQTWRMDQKTREQLLVELGNAHLELIRTSNEKTLTSAISVLDSALPLDDFRRMLEYIAGMAKKNIEQNQSFLAHLAGASSSVVDLPACVRFGLILPTRLANMAQAEALAGHFLDILLQNIEPQKSEWLDRQTKKWPTDLLMEWQKYKAARPFLFLDTKSSFFERFQLWQEDKIALLKISWALKRNNLLKRALVSLETTTTLGNYQKSIPDKWQEKIDEALNSFDEHRVSEMDAALEFFGEHKSQVSTQLLIPGSDVAKKNMSWFARLRLQWTFRPVRRALNRGSIGKIVAVSTNLMPLLIQYQAEVSPYWWLQIDVAFDFFDAFADVLTNTNVKYESAFLMIVDKIDALAKAGYPMPGLTAHEWKRVKIAEKYIDAWQKQNARPV